MKTVATNEAKTHLSALLQQVSAGETIIIARGRRPLAKLVPYEDARAVRPKVGEMLDRRTTVPAAVLRPLGDRELRAWGLKKIRHFGRIPEKCKRRGFAAQGCQIAPGRRDPPSALFGDAPVPSAWNF